MLYGYQKTEQQCQRLRKQRLVRQHNKPIQHALEIHLTLRASQHKRVSEREF